MKNHFGFTLAEVLITLGIIGVVAAMTMPTLMNSTQGAQYKAAYKKALSVLSQAVTLNMALDDWNLADLAKDTTEGGAYMFSKLLKDRTNYVRLEHKKALTGYTINGCTSTTADGKTTTTCPAGVTEPSSANVTFFFNDGIMFTYKAEGAEKCTKPEGTTVEKFIADNKANGKCVGYVDVNGIKGPNKTVVCDSGTNTTSKPCTVTNPTDIYPVVFFDQSVLPATEAAKTVLYGK